MLQGLEHMRLLFCCLYLPFPNAWNFWFPSNPRGVQIMPFALCNNVCMAWSGFRAEKWLCFNLKKKKTKRKQKTNKQQKRKQTPKQKKPPRSESCRLQYLNFIRVGHKEHFSHGDIWIWSHLSTLFYFYFSCLPRHYPCNTRLWSLITLEMKTEILNRLIMVWGFLHQLSLTSFRKLLPSPT